MRPFCRTAFAKDYERGQSNDPFIAPDRKAKAIAEVLGMIANAHSPLAPNRPRPVLEADDSYSKPPPNFARLWKNMPSAQCSLRK